MSVVVGEDRRPSVAAPAAAAAAGLILIALVVGAGSGFRLAAAPLALVVLVAAAHKRLLAWRSLVGLTMLTIIFVPIKRYTLPSALPFQLEFYRLIVALVAFAWVTSLLIDKRVRLRSSGLEAPLFLYLFAVLISLMTNPHRVNLVGADVIKTLTFFLSFFLVFYLVVSVARRARDIDFLVRILAGGAAVLAVFAIIEERTGYNLFNHLTSALPILHYYPSLGPSVSRGGRLRVYASAQHPIALGAAFAMLLPLAVYRARAFGQRRWWFAAVLILFGLLATRSRTSIVMLLAILLVYAVLRAQDMKRLWWAVLPILIAIHIVLPGALGTVRGSFFPKGGIIAEQANTPVGSGRIATLGPALRSEWVPNPIFGEGFATRVTVPDPVVPVPNGPILDNQWLGIVLETGVVGTLAFGWLFARAIRRMGRAAKRDPSPRGWLLASVAASVAGCAVSLFTYDAFSFIQATFLMFIVLGIGSATLLSPRADWDHLAETA